MDFGFKYCLMSTLFLLVFHKYYDIEKHTHTHTHTTFYVMAYDKETKLVLVANQRTTQGKHLCLIMLTLKLN